MQVNESAARQMLEEMGKAKPDTPTKRVLFRLNNIQTILEDATDPTGDNAVLLKKVFKAVENGEDIELASVKEVPVKVPSANGKPAKEPAVEKREPAKEKKKRKDDASSLSSKWTPADVNRELKQLAKKHKNDLEAMIKDVKKFARNASPPHDELARLVLAELRNKEGAPEEEAEEEATPSRPSPNRGGGKDAFGNLLSSQGHLINEVLSKKPKSTEQIMEETKLTRSRVKSHLNWLRDERKLIEETEAGWAVK